MADLPDDLERLENIAANLRARLARIEARIRRLRSDAPAAARTFTDLWVGDRFTAFGELWTKLDHQTARQHRKESIALGERGCGYLLDTICSFRRDDAVQFVPPRKEL